MGGVTTDVIGDCPEIVNLANNVISEVANVANADILKKYLDCHKRLGTDASSISPCPHFLEDTAIKEKLWGAVKLAGPYKMSVLVDLLEGKELEMEHIFRIPLRRAKELKAEDPTLSISYFDSLVCMVEGMHFLYKKRKALGVAWSPTYVEAMLAPPTDP